MFGNFLFVNGLDLIGGFSIVCVYFVRDFFCIFICF